MRFRRRIQEADSLKNKGLGQNGPVFAVLAMDAKMLIFVP
jgi:hypothetical protein